MRQHISTCITPSTYLKYLEHNIKPMAGKTEFWGPFTALAHVGQCSAFGSATKGLARHQSLLPLNSAAAFHKEKSVPLTK